MVKPDKAMRQMVVELRAKLDEIQQGDISLEAQITLKECSDLCAQLTVLLGGQAPESSLADGENMPESNRKTLLVVDDDEDTLRLLSYLLSRKAGFRVVCKNNAKDALECMSEVRPDVILMDLMMPQMSGFEFLRKIRQEEQWKHIKIMVGSSRSYDKDRLTTLEAGANDFIAKPYHLDELVLRLRNLAAQ